MGGGGGGNVAGSTIAMLAIVTNEKPALKKAIARRFVFFLGGCGAKKKGIPQMGGSGKWMEHLRSCILGWTKTCGLTFILV